MHEQTHNADQSKQAFELLSSGPRQWVAKKKWNSFREIQSSAIMAMLGGNTENNLVVSAGTAMGKTESAFLPALTIAQNHMDENRDDDFVYILYVAPLKALINDQYRRMSEMSAYANIPVYLWHGDAPVGQKQQLMKEHSGILMITPESLESFLMNRGQWCNDYLTPLVMIIDEFHAFLGEGRGKQLLSLLSRIDAISIANGREPARRIALSATLSKLQQVGKILSPQRDCIIIDGTALGTSETNIEVETFEEPPKRDGQKHKKNDFDAMAQVIIDESVGQKTLTFARSRSDVETMSATINDICTRDNQNIQAFPHHGSLSKETREELEYRLVNTEKPTIAVATVTLELGIDIGDIYKVFQIGSTNSVASLRQRVGRSGRRDGQRKLKSLITLRGPADLEEDLTITMAEIELMEQGWFEPPQTKRRDISVLFSEILSVLAQYGNAYPDELYGLLCINGAFSNISRDLFDMVIRDMADARVILIDRDDLIMLDEIGEREINDWHFYATFQSEEAYAVRNGKKTIGEIIPPETSLQMLAGGGTFMLGGKYWQVIPPMDMKNKVINVKQTSSRASFLIPVSKGGGDVNGMIKRKRISLLSGKDIEYIPEYLDDNGKKALSEARTYAKEHYLNALGLMIYDAGEKGSETDSEIAARLKLGYTDDADVKCVPPVDGAAMNALVMMLTSAGMAADGLDNIPLYRLIELIGTCLSMCDEMEKTKEKLIDDAMLNELRNREKYNAFFANDTLRLAYADEIIDVAGARKWMEAFMRFAENR